VPRKREGDRETHEVCIHRLLTSRWTIRGHLANGPRRMAATAARKDARGARGFIFGCSATIPSIYDIAVGTPVPRDSRPENFLSILARGRSSGLRFCRIERTTSASSGYRWTVNQEISMFSLKRLVSQRRGPTMD